MGPARLAAGARLGRYEILEAIAAGGMGDVYRARDTLLPRPVAIKTVKLAETASRKQRARLQHEARIAARLKHPHICRIYDLGREGEVDFVVMEYLEGETLQRRLERGPLGAAEAIRLAMQIIDALAEAHRHGVIHRDLKPANVMLTGPEPRPDVSLLDFGIATHEERSIRAETLTAEELTRDGHLLGTTAYMSPEQLLGDRVDARTDIWSFGVVLHEMIAGRHPFAASSSAAIAARILEHEAHPLALDAAPPALHHIVERCLAKQPRDRWRNASEIAPELERCGADSAASSPSRSGKKATGHPLSTAAARHAAEAPAPGPLESTERRPLVVAGQAAVIAASAGAAAAGLYLTNPSVGDAVLYPLLALVGALPIVAMAAAIAGDDIATAARRLLSGLGSLGGALSHEQPRGRFVAGASLALLFGATIAFLLGHAADNVMPHLQFLPHATNANAEWAVTDVDSDWGTYRAQYKTAYLAHTRGTEADFQQQKHELGRGSVRAARTLFGFAVILAGAGIADLVGRRRARGLASLIAGVSTALLLYTFWYLREGNYAKEMVAASLRLPAAVRPMLPDSAPEGLKRLVEAH